MNLRRCSAVMSTVRAVPMALAVLLAVLVAGSGRARAEDARHAPEPQDRAALADAWLNDAVHAQLQRDAFGRYVGAPAAALLGGMWLLLPAVVDFQAAPAAAFMTGGALMLTDAVGVWATPDPYAAQRWATNVGSLGFVALDTGLIACSRAHAACSPRSAINRHLLLSIGAVNAGFFLSVFLTSLLRTPDPERLEAGAGPDD